LNPYDLDKDGDCWLYVMYKAHTLEITPQEVVEMETRLSRFATKNPGFEQYQVQLHRALADPDVMEELRLATKARISEAGMRKAAWEEGEKKGEERGKREGKKEEKREGRKEEKKEVAIRMLKRGRPLDEIVEDTELSLDVILALQRDAK
jgi:hypothetical protein